MHRESIQGWQHDHTFGQDRRRSGESRSLVVIALTAIMMAVEIAAASAGPPNPEIPQRRMEQFRRKVGGPVAA